MMHFRDEWLQKSIKTILFALKPRIEALVFRPALHQLLVLKY